MSVRYEYNAAIVNAYSKKNPDLHGVDLGYELLRRSVGTRKWEVVKTTQDWDEASEWAAQSGYTIRGLR